MQQLQVPRRAFLRGLGTLMALPALESLSGLKALADGAGAKQGPKRLAFIYSPNGMNMADWTPSQTGADFELTPILEPLRELRSQWQVLTGLAQDKGRPHGDGAGDHARALGSYLTASQPRKTSGADIKAGVSVDQIAARKAGLTTRFASLELGCDRSQLAGNCDSGYSCAYSFNLSWKTDATPMPPEVDPRQVFERLFAGVSRRENAESRARRQRYERSILDYVFDDARRLQSKLGYTDKRKLDEYLTAVRELEVRIEKAEKFAQSLPDYSGPSGIPKEYQLHLRLMYDLLALAFQTDTTRVATFITAHDGSNRAYPFIGVSEGHHDLSHHGNDTSKKEKIARINKFHATQIAYFLQKLDSLKEGESSVLDNSMIVFGSGLADGNRHDHGNLPVLLAGRGAGSLHPGRHVKFDREVPMANLFLSLLDRMDVKLDRFGDSTGRVENI